MSVAVLKFTTRAYLFLTKPGIVLGNIVTTIAGFAFASNREFDFSLLAWMIIGIAFVMGSACVFNNYIDQELDQKMKRTRNRPLVKGDISERAALIFGIVLGVLGWVILWKEVNFLSMILSLIGFGVYVGLYSVLKYHSVHFTLIGSVAGAIPPVVGYCAVTNSLDVAAWMLFAIVLFWQMPHFFAIALYRLEDYIAGKIPVLPLKKGIKATKIQILIYLIAFLASLVLPFVYGYTGWAYLITSCLLGGAWLVIALQGFFTSDEKKWARKIFLFSLVVVMGISLSFISFKSYL